MALTKNLSRRIALYWLEIINIDVTRGAKRSPTFRLSCTIVFFLRIIHLAWPKMTFIFGEYKCITILSVLGLYIPYGDLIQNDENTVPNPGLSEIGHIYIAKCRIFWTLFILLTGKWYKMENRRNLEWKRLMQRHRRTSFALVTCGVGWNWHPAHWTRRYVNTPYASQVTQRYNPHPRRQTRA